jgi:hypothetical protein
VDLLMSENGRGLRIAIDTVVFIWLIGVSFVAGKQVQRLDNMSQRGGVQISMEADRRLTVLETNSAEHARRIERLERE